MAEPLPGIPLQASPTLNPTRGPLSAEMQEIRRVAQEFESMVLAELLQPVFNQLGTDGLTGGGSGEEMFRPMLVQEYAKSMAQAGGVGLADAVVKEMINMQGLQQPGAPAAYEDELMTRNAD